MPRTAPPPKKPFFETLQHKVNDLLITFHIKDKPLTDEEKELFNLTPEQIQIQQEAGELLSRNAYEQFFILVKYGYEPSVSQKNKLQTLFIDSFNLITGAGYRNYEETSFPYNQLLEFGYKMTNQEMLYVLFNSTFQIYCEDCFNIRKQRVDFFNQKFQDLPEDIINETIKNAKPAFKNLVKSIKQANQNPHFCDAVFEEFYKKITHIGSSKNYISIKHDLKPIYSIYQEKWLENANHERLAKIKQMSQILSQYSKGGHTNAQDALEIVSLMNNVVMSFDHDKFLNLVEKTKKAYTNSKADIRIDIFRDAIPKQARDLPEEAIKHIQFIEEKCMMLEKHKELLTVEQSFTLKNLVEQRLPEILNEYKNIPEEIRETITVDNKKAKDLLLSALDNIAQVVSEINLSLGEAYLQNLKVSENYTKKLSMGKNG